MRKGHFVHEMNEESVGEATHMGMKVCGEIEKGEVSNSQAKLWSCCKHSNLINVKISW